MSELRINGDLSENKCLVFKDELELCGYILCVEFGHCIQNHVNSHAGVKCSHSNE